MVRWPCLHNKALKCVVLRHTLANGAWHYDVMVEHRPGSRLWTLNASGIPLKTETIKLTAHGTHRRRYFWFEGDIGHGRGRVSRLRKGSLLIYVEGGSLRACFEFGSRRAHYEVARSGRGLYVLTKLGRAVQKVA
jgi:hypothetical protein